MDTSLPPDERAGEKEEPMDIEAASKPHSSTSAPVSQNASGLGLGPALSVPSQPELSHVCASFFYQVSDYSTHSLRSSRNKNFVTFHQSVEDDGGV